jgi:spore maturation protein SpmB
MILFPVVNTIYSVAVYFSDARVKQITRTSAVAKRLRLQIALFSVNIIDLLLFSQDSRRMAPGLPR